MSTELHVLSYYFIIIIVNGKSNNSNCCYCCNSSSMYATSLSYQVSSNLLKFFDHFVITAGCGYSVHHYIGSENESYCGLYIQKTIDTEKIKN